MLYYQSMHKNLEDKERKKHNSKLDRFFIFFKFSLFGRVTLSRSSFIQTSIFRKNPFFFYHFQHGIFFLSIAFYSRHVSFFANFQSTPKMSFSKKTNMTLIFLIFHFYSK